MDFIKVEEFTGFARRYHFFKNCLLRYYVYRAATECDDVQISVFFF
jgi:hypothetical protein